MNYTVTVYKDGVAIETHWFNAHLEARVAELELRKKYQEARIEIDEV